MIGVRQRIKADAEGDLATAHAAATFNALATAGKLDRFEKYLRQPKGAETLDEIMGKWNGLVAAGYPITIREVRHGS